MSEETVAAATEEEYVDPTEAGQPFADAVAEAVAAGDESTGTVPVALVEAVKSAYRDLTGLKAKNAARAALSKGLKDEMQADSLPRARSYMNLSEAVKSAPKAAPKEHVPADPTETFLDRLATMSYAFSFARNDVPAGVAEDWADQLQEKLKSLESDYNTLVAFVPTTESEDEEGNKVTTENELPDVAPVMAAAYKLAHRKSISGVRLAGTSSASGTRVVTYEGPRRDVGKHIQNAFADEPVGTFKLISAIRVHKSDEYGDDLPSAGAISARLPLDKPVTIEGIDAAVDANGKRGAVKTA